MHEPSTSSAPPSSGSNQITRDATAGNLNAFGHHITFGEAVRVWLRVAILSFGGPAGQIAVMHRILVDEKQWVSESRFLHALNYCMVLPGPEAQQLATYIGWLRAPCSCCRAFSAFWCSVCSTLDFRKRHWCRPCFSVSRRPCWRS